MKFIFASAILFNLSFACLAQTGNSQNKQSIERLTILKQPKAKYTKEARKNRIEGEVKLRVIFQANNKIGSIEVISNLGYGLTEQAVIAAKQIEFTAEKRNGQSVSIIKTVVYVFTL